MSKKFKEDFEYIGTYWNTKKGLTFFFIVFISLYYGVISEFIKKNMFDIPIFRTWVIPISCLILIFLLWAFRSHRVNLYKRKKITTGLFLKCDDFDSELKMKKIINDMIEEIETNFVDIKLKFFPINYIKNQAQLEKFVMTHNHIIDNAFFATIYYGNCIEDSKQITKIEIQDIRFSAQFSNKEQTDFRSKINMSQNLKLRNLDKNWEYFDSRSFTDKIKIKHNLKDSILFFNGLYSICMKEYDLALKILKNLKLSEDTYTSYGKSNRVQKERLNNILLALFTFNSIEKYLVKKDSDTAFNLLKECEKIFQDNHKFSFKNYLTLSRIYYEKGEISLAYIYTEKAMKISRNCSSIYCNLGFFGMIENNIDQVYTNYRELAHVYKFKKTLNFIDVIHFIELHKSKHSESIDLFEFAIATLNFLYVDKILGRKQLNDLKEKLKENKEYLKINSLIDFFLTKGSIKSPYFQRDKKRKYIQK